MGQILNFELYTVAWIAVLPIEAEAALGMLDNRHDGQFETLRGDDYIYIGGDVNRHNVVIATWPEGQNYGVGSAAALVNQVKARFSNIWFALLVGVAAGLPNLSPKPPAKYRDIRLGDVLVCIPEKESVGIVCYDLGQDTEEGFFRNGRQAETPAIIRAAIGNIKLTKEKPFKSGNDFSRYLTAFQEKDEDRKFLCPSQQEDQLLEYVMDRNNQVVRDLRDELERTKVWYGNIGSGNSLMRNPRRRDELRDKHDLIGLEMEAAGIMNTLPTGVIRGVCDYGDAQKNKDWQPYAAAVAAVYAKGVLYTIKPKVSQAQKGQLHIAALYFPRFDSVNAMAMEIQELLGLIPSGTANTYWLVKFQRNEHFVGRDPQLDELSAKLSLQGHCQRVAITGLGGVGKTQIVLEFAYRTRQKFLDCSVFWIPAINPLTFEQAYLQIGQLLKIPGITEEKANVKQLVQTRLSQESAGPWLLIIDNADDIDMLYQRANEELPLVDYLPSSPKGSIIFTTRNRKAAVKLVGNNVIEVGEMNQADAKVVLEKSLIQTHLDEHESVIQLLELLTYLPLAIVQAAAYINENDISISEYVAIYKRDSEKDIIEVLSEDFEDRGRYRDIENPVATTWLISFEQVRRQDPLAAEYLSFMACLIRENIPQSLLLPGASRNKEIKAIGTLTAYSFITKRVTEGLFDMHRLVYLVTRNWLRNQDQLSIWANKALIRLASIVPAGGHEGRETWTAYLPHAIYIVSSLDTSSEKREVKIKLLSNIGHCQYSIGQYKAAEGTHRRTLELTEKVSGKEHPDTLASMNNLAAALSGQGKYVEAEAIHRRTLELREKVLGKEHPDTLMSMNNLAEALSGQGKYVEAEAIHRWTLELSEKVSGKEHPDTLTSMNNLAGTLSGQRKYVEAEAMHRRMLELKEKVSGKEHPDTLMSMNNLAEALSGQGKYVEAEAMHRWTLKLREKVSEKEHPDTLMSMNNLAAALSGQRKYAEAEAIHRRTLELREKLLGKEHPDTLASVWWLAHLLQCQRRYDGSAILYERACAGFQKVLGSDHPTTLSCLKQHASMLKVMKK